MATLDDGLKAFYDDLSAQGLLNNTLVLVYSEFGRRISENGSAGHRPRRRRQHDGARRPRARRPLRHGAEPQHRSGQSRRSRTTARDVKYETDFRSVYAKILDSWLGSNSVAVLGADYRAGAPSFL